jgi:sulfur carrier protein ThiS
MIVHVKTVGALRSLEEGTRVIPLEVPEETSVLQVIEHLGLKDEEIGFVLINGEHRDRASILKNQDQLILVGLLAGG